MPQNSVKTYSLLLYTAQVLLLAGLYFASGQASFSLAVSHTIVTLVIFAAEGFALAAVILWGKNLWLGVFLGQLTLALYNGLAWNMALGISAINSLEAVIGAILFHRFGLQSRFTRIRDVSGLLILIFFVLQPFSATFGVLLLWMHGTIPTANLGVSWFSWWFGNAMGQAIITPLVLSFLGDKKNLLQKWHNAIWLITLIIPVAIIGLFPASFSNITIAFTLAIPLFIIIAAQGGMALVTLATIILTAITLVFTRQQISESLSHGDLTLLLDLNAHLLAMVLTGQFVAAFLAEYKQAQQARQEVSEYLQKISDNFPGIICEFRLNPDGSTCFPYASVGIQDIYHLSPDEVKEDASKIFSLCHHEDYEQVISSISESAQNLTPWQCDYRVCFEDGTMRWLSGHSVPQREENGATLWHGFIRDVTKVKQIEVEYQTVIDSTFSGFWCVDFSGRFLNVNPALCNMLGYSQQELLAMGIADIEAKETHDDIAAHIQFIIQTGRAKFESLHRCKDGSVIDVEVNVLYVESLGQRMFGFVNDISETKQARKALAISEEKYRSLFNSIQDGIVYADIHGNILDCNQYYCDMLGYSKQELTKMDCHKITPEKWHDFEADIIERLVMTRGHSDLYEKEFIKKDGTVFPIDLRAWLIRDKQNNPAGMWALVRDISERKHLENELRKQHDELLCYFDQPFIGMLTSAHDKHTLHANQRFCDMVGYSQTEMQVIDWGKITHPDDMALNQAYLDQAIRGEIDDFQMEKRFIHKDGHIVYVDLAVHFVRKTDEQLDYSIGMMLDITERKLAQQRLQESEERLNLSQEYGGIGSWEADLIDHTQTWSRTVYDLGFPALSNPTWEDFLAIVHDDDKQTVIDAGAAHLKHNTKYDVEYRALLTDGKIHWMRSAGQAQFASDGTPLRFIGIVQDITERKLEEQQLQKTTEQLQLVLEGGHFGFWDWNIVTGDVQRNAIWAEILGYTHSEIENTTNQWEDFIYEDDRTRAWQSIHDVLEGRSLYHEVEYRMLHKDGTIRWILDHASIVQRDTCGKPLRMSGVHIDITKLKNLEEQLRKSENFFSSLAQISPVGIYRTDASGNCIFVNQRWCEIAGMGSQQAQRLGWRNAIMVDDREKVDTEWAIAVRERRQFKLEYRFQQPNGNIIWVYGQSTIIYDEDGQILGFVGTVTDITERKATEEYISQLAFYDPLTQLPNRRLLKERLKHGIEVSRRSGNHIAVLMMDLDKFKQVNDTLGHAAGDQLLIQVAERIKTRLREVDTVARLGGDEFVILLGNISHYQHIARIAEAMIDSLSQQFILFEKDKVYIGASIGIAIHPQHGDSEEALMDNADAALYYAKEQGRGRFAFFSEQLTQKARERMIAESRLRHAIEHQELQIRFQPQVDMNSGQIIGAETLVCWQDSQLGNMSAGDFIELAKETGLIVAIDEWVLQETCWSGRQWLDQGLPPICLAVNISNNQFRRHNINELIAKILETSLFPAEYLRLEMTEVDLMDNQKNTLDILTSLHNQGVHLAIDHFGTGYSSLRCLKDFPIDQLKIDKSFIDETSITPDSHTIITTIIATAHILGVKVLADGVETAEQLAFLRQQGCDSYQGNLYSQALTAESFAQLLQGNLTK